ncbi:uncharacterized protein C8Q71DRAFT_314386 [Rhodofomes roseus]|uniref:Secreted protein n=1 Tax=Rhodofomes roseus TaxID=34475 RepID=A0ABQ8K2C1_9APHY|nr:uncharacterized protein C8Q71DRAFT_314386 [Rhodofomes roseus]KAH9830914.1 hypothetical protein C8Q71DRAFT_314386 [Rhodofomes roseus]
MLYLVTLSFLLVHAVRGSSASLLHLTPRGAFGGRPTTRQHLYHSRRMFDSTEPRTSGASPSQCRRMFTSFQPAYLEHLSLVVRASGFYRGSRMGYD